MHREYHPEDGPHHHHDHGHAEELTPGSGHGPLFAFTAVLGLLIAADLVLGRLGGALHRSGTLSPSLVAAVIGGIRLVYLALDALRHGRIGADFALAQACVAALVLGDAFVAAEVVFIAMVGECLEALTADRAFRAIGRLFEQVPRTARILREGVESEVPIADLRPGDRVAVPPGEKVTVDGRVIAGRSTIDESALSGESMPVDKEPGAEVFAGTLNQFGRLEVEVHQVGSATTLGQVLELVAHARDRKAPLERAADRYARWFLPVVETAAALTLATGWWLGWPDVWHRVVAILVVACPCALVLATPAAVLASMAWLARRGIVIKGGVALERLAACDALAFDKTGTLTLGRPEVVTLAPAPDFDEATLLRLAATAEASNRHPLAVAVTHAAANRGLEPATLNEVEVLPGAGVVATAWWPEGGPDTSTILVGNRRLLEDRGLPLGPDSEAALEAAAGRGETSLLVAIDGRVAGVLTLADAVRPEAHDVVHDLKHLGFRDIALLTGDQTGPASRIARKVHIRTVEAGLLPAEKAAWIRARQAEGRRVAMIGDGINDAPALATADVGLAIAGLGSQLAAEAGDIVVLGDPLRNLPDLVRLSRKTVAILRQNILGFAFGLNAVAMLAAALGVLGPVAAAVLHQAGSLLVLLNAMRLLAFGGWSGIAPARFVRAVVARLSTLDQRLDLGLAFEFLWSRRLHLAALALVALAAAYSARGWVALDPGEVGLLTRQGRYAGLLGPGLHLRWPPPLERVVRVRPAELRSLQLGVSPVAGGPDTTRSVRWETDHSPDGVVRNEDDALVLTGDGKLVEVAASIQYRVADRPGSVRRYVLGTENPEAVLRAEAESVLRRDLSRRRLDEILGDRRGEAESILARELQERADALVLGVTVVSATFQHAHPPLAVLDAYRDVARAESEKETRVNAGTSYRLTRVHEARGQAAAATEAAGAEGEARVLAARGEADAFVLAARARSGHPALTDHRRFWEELATTLAGRDKVLLDAPNAGPRRHLLLPDGAWTAAPAWLTAPPRTPGSPPVDRAPGATLAVPVPATRP